MFHKEFVNFLAKEDIDPIMGLYPEEETLKALNRFVTEVWVTKDNPLHAELNDVILAKKNAVEYYISNISRNSNDSIKDYVATSRCMIYLVERGKQVLVIDADIELGNLDTYSFNNIEDAFDCFQKAKQDAVIYESVLERELHQRVNNAPRQRVKLVSRRIGR